MTRHPPACLNDVGNQKHSTHTTQSIRGHTSLSGDLHGLHITLTCFNDDGHEDPRSARPIAGSGRNISLQDIRSSDPEDLLFNDNWTTTHESAPSPCGEGLALHSDANAEDVYDQEEGKATLRERLMLDPRVNLNELNMEEMLEPPNNDRPFSNLCLDEQTKFGVQRLLRERRARGPEFEYPDDLYVESGTCDDDIVREAQNVFRRRGRYNTLRNIQSEEGFADENHRASKARLAATPSAIFPTKFREGSLDGRLGLSPIRRNNRPLEEDTEEELEIHLRHRRQSALPYGRHDQHPHTSNTRNGGERLAHDTSHDRQVGSDRRDFIARNDHSYREGLLNSDIHTKYISRYGRPQGRGSSLEVRPNRAHTRHRAHSPPGSRYDRSLPGSRHIPVPRHACPPFALHRGRSPPAPYRSHSPHFTQTTSSRARNSDRPRNENTEARLDDAYAFE